MSELLWGIGTLLFMVGVDYAAWRWSWVPDKDDKAGLVWKRGKWRESRRGGLRDDHE